MSSQTPEKPTEVKFYYEKAHAFRVIHVDGAQGSMSPNGRNIQMALFSERRTIPREQHYKLDQDSRPEEKPFFVEDKKGIFREIEVLAIMDIDIAVALRDWLGKQIETWKENHPEEPANE